MSNPIIEVFPDQGHKRTIEGLYIQQDLRSQFGDRSGPFVYANFISSLDGRIAIPHADEGLTVPSAISNPRDWRLFQELAIQADILLSSGRYLREYAAGRAQEILRIYDDPKLTDLAEWRLARGLDRYPPIAVISASLNFPIPPALIDDGRKVVILTTEDAPEDRMRDLTSMGLEVIPAGKARVAGEAAIRKLSDRGYRLIYSTAGPKVLHLLLETRVLDRLYLTFAARILGGEPFATIMEGPVLPQPADFSLRYLYLDPHAPGSGGQLFATYDTKPSN